MLISKKKLIASLSITNIFWKLWYGDEFTDFYDKQIPKADSNHTCLAVISLDYALTKDNNYYLQVSLKEFKYIEKKLVRHIIDDLESSSDDFNDSDDSDEECS